MDLNDEMAAILDRFATYQEPIYIVGDFNIRLDRHDDPHADQFRLLIDCYGLKLHATGPTHQLGGTLDAVVTQSLPAVLTVLWSKMLGFPTTTCCAGRSVRLETRRRS